MLQVFSLLLQSKRYKGFARNNMRNKIKTMHKQKIIYSGSNVNDIIIKKSM